MKVQKNWKDQDSTLSFVSFRIICDTKQGSFLKQFTGYPMNCYSVLECYFATISNTVHSIQYTWNCGSTRICSWNRSGCLLLPKKNNRFLCFQLYITINLKRYISFQATSWLTLKEDSELLPWKPHGVLCRQLLPEKTENALAKILGSLGTAGQGGII